MKALPAEERPLEKGLLQGIETLSNTELFALLLHTGTKEKSALMLAQEIIGLRGGIFALREVTAEELMQIKGIGKSKAIRIQACIELGKRLGGRPLDRPICVKDPQDIASLFMEEMRSYRRETFKTVLLNAKGAILSVETISIGELTSTLVHPREVFQPAVRKSAAAIILVHNHPSGDPTPSGDDFGTTKRLVECGKLLGVNVLDHLIIGNGTFVSMRELGQI